MKALSMKITIETDGAGVVTIDVRNARATDSVLLRVQRLLDAVLEHGGAGPALDALKKAAGGPYHCNDADLGGPWRTSEPRQPAAPPPDDTYEVWRESGGSRPAEAAPPSTEPPAETDVEPPLTRKGGGS